MSVFTKAAAKKKAGGSSSKPAKKETVWAVGDPDGDKVANSVHELSVLNAQKKAIDAKMKVHKTVVLSHAQNTFYQQYADSGVFPETPMKVQNRDGESVTFVVQERNQYGVKDESVAALTQLLGEDGAGDLVYEETVFSFSRELLAREGVMEILGKHIDAAMSEMVESHTLSEDEAADLLDADVKRSYRPGLLQRLGIIAGKNATRIRQICDAIGSGCVQYVKV